MYYGNIENHIAPYFKDVLLKKLRLDIIQKFINKKALSGRLDGKPGGLGFSMLQELAVNIARALEKAVDNKMILENVARENKITAKK